MCLPPRLPHTYITFPTTGVLGDVDALPLMVLRSILVYMHLGVFFSVRSYVLILSVAVTTK